jgi:hypothetical protein
MSAFANFKGQPWDIEAERLRGLEVDDQLDWIANCAGRSAEARAGRSQTVAMRVRTGGPPPSHRWLRPISLGGYRKNPPGLPPVDLAGRYIDRARRRAHRRRILHHTEIKQDRGCRVHDGRRVFSIRREMIECRQCDQCDEGNAHHVVKPIRPRAIGWSLVLPRLLFSKFSGRHSTKIEPVQSERIGLRSPPAGG